MAQIPEVGSQVRLRLTTHDGNTEIEGVVLPPAVGEHITIKIGKWIQRQPSNFFD